MQVDPAAAVMGASPTLIAAAIVTVLAALTSSIIQIVSALSAARDRRDAAQERAVLLRQSQISNDKADEIIVGTAKIHELTNSTNSNLQKALEVATERIAGLEKMVARGLDERREAQVDKQIDQALRTPVPTAPTPPAAAAPAGPATIEAPVMVTAPKAS